MKKNILFLAVALFGITFCSSSFAKDLKIGYVDVYKVFNEYDKTKESEGVLDKKKKEVETKLIEKKASIEEIQNKLETLNEEQQKVEEGKLIEQAKEYRDLERTAVVDIRKERDDKMKEILEDINEVTKEYSETNDFDLVVNENTLLYSGDSIINITDQILKICNNNYKK